MASSRMIVHLDISEIIQKVIVKNEDLLDKYSTGSKTFDFTPGDYVKCTILQSFYQVKDINGPEVVIQNLQKTEDLKKIDPNFLKKIELDDRWVKVLYEDRSRRLHNMIQIKKYIPL